MIEEVDVAVVGGGPAGAIVAALLARAGHEVVLLERTPAWRWRACGVFASPAAHRALARTGLDSVVLDRVARPIPAMRLETPGGAQVRLTYGDDGSPGASAVGFDRSSLDPALLALAAREGTSVRREVALTGGDLARRPELALRTATGATRLRARVVVGADGIRSTVARLAGVARRAWLRDRIGLTFHLDDPRDRELRPDARMVVLKGAYCGLAPVPGGRLNVGIVLAGERWGRALAREGSSALVARILRVVPAAADDGVPWAEMTRSDPIAGASPLAHRVARHAGPTWLLAGDAAGFLDPFTGEGIHRACISAELAATAVDARLRGRLRAMAAYDREMRRRFATKDIVSQLVIAFLARPGLFEYAASRLARRREPRETMSLVMGDLVPASRALDPRFLAALLSP